MKHFDVSGLSVETYGLGGGIFFCTNQTPHLHRHNEIELNFLESGAITYIFGATRTPMKVGDFALFWAAIPHQIVEAEEQSVLYTLTIPLASFLQWQLPNGIVQDIICGKFVSGPSTVEDQSALIVLKRWYTDLGRRTVEHQRIVLLEVEAYLHRFALHMQTENTLPVLPTQEQAIAHMHELNKIEQMACFIADHYTEPLRIKEIARRVNLHPSYAMSLFRKAFGISMLDYITQYRLAHAQRLLITTDANASEIALASGFGSVSRFYAAFKSAYGQAPRKYRSTRHLL